MTPRARSRIPHLTAIALLAACATVQRAPSTPAAMLERAIAQAGGAEALGRARALAWEGDAAVHAGGRDVNIAGRWAVQPPDSAVIETWETSRGPSASRALVVAAPRGWMVSGGRFVEMPPPVLANERDEMYLYDVIRLVALRGPGVTLTPIAADSLGQPGFRAEQPGRPAVDLWVDPAGRLTHVRMQVQDPMRGGTATQDAWLGGALEAGGVRWPATIRLTLNGAPYFDLALRNLRILPRIDDARTSGPP